MLTLALAWAEVLQVQDIFIGVSAADYYGYPDYRPAYIRAAVKGRQLTIHAPLLYLSKADITR